MERYCASKLSSGFFGFYQFGIDGFLITAQSTSVELSVAISVAVTLLRMSLKHNSVRKVKVSYGNLGDFSSLYDDLKSKYNSAKRGERINIAGQGLSRSAIFLASPVVGTSLIAAYGLRCPHGPLLCVDNIYEEDIKTLGIEGYSKHDKCLTINWLNYICSDIENHVAKIIGKDYHEKEIKNLFCNYLENEFTGSSDEWILNAKNLL